MLYTPGSGTIQLSDNDYVAAGPPDKRGPGEVVWKSFDGTITRLSTDLAGAQGNSHSYGPSISADGRYVAFDSEVPGAGDTPGPADVFLVRLW